MVQVEPALGGEKDVTHPAATELALDGVRIAERGLESVAQLGHRWDESSGMPKNDRHMHRVRLAISATRRPPRWFGLRQIDFARASAVIRSAARNASAWIVIVG